MVQKYKEPVKPVVERNIRVQLPRLNAKNKKIIRCYTTLQNAIIGGIRWLLIHGKVGDRIELYHEVTSYQFGVIRLNVHGAICSDFSYKDYL